MLGAHLVMRPRPLTQESTPGYLLRVAMANGLSSIPALFRACCDRGSLFPFDALRKLLGLEDEEVLQLFGPLPSRWGKNEPPEELTVQDFIHTYRRWCPLCLSKQAYQQGYWDLKLVTLCTRHQVWLQDRCPQCGAKQGWNGSSLLYCTCGYCLSDGSAEPAGGLPLGLTKALLPESTATAGPDVGLPAGGQLSRIQWQRLVCRLGQFSSGVQPSRPGQLARLDDLGTARTIIENAAAIFHEWPTRFVRLLEDIQAAAGPSISLKTSFGVLYRLLYVELDHPAYQFLRDCFEDHLKTNWWGVVCRRNSRLKPSTLERQTRMTKKQACQATGVRPSVLQHLAQQELLPIQDVPLPSGRKARTFRQADVAAAAEVVQGAGNLSELARHANIAERRVRDLVKLGVLKPIISRAGGSSWLFSADDFRQMLVPTDALETGDRPMVALASLLKSGRLAREEGGAFIAAILAREVRGFSESGGMAPVGQVVLGKEEVVCWRTNWRQHHGGPLSIPEAAIELCLKQEVVYHLIRRGLLHAKHASTGWKVDQQAIHDFREKYVALADLAREKRTSPRHLMSSITAHPVSGPEVDGGRQYFFWRSEVMACHVDDR